MTKPHGALFRRILAVASAATLLAVLAPAPLAQLSATEAQPEPSLSIELTPGRAVPANTEITATITLSGLDPSSYDSVVLRADVTHYGRAEDLCEGDGAGEDIDVDVDDSTEVLTATISDFCPVGGPYELRVKISRVSTETGDKIRLASARARFVVSRYLFPGVEIGPPPDPKPDAWLDPDPRTLEIRALGQWHRFFVRSDVLDSDFDHVGVIINIEDDSQFASTSIPHTTTSPPGPSSEDACGAEISFAYRWRRAVNQSVWILACKPGTAKLMLYSDTVAQSYYTYEFRVLAEDEDTPPPPPLSADATLNSLTLSGVPFSFDAATNGYTLSVAHDTERTTVTAATSHSAASYAVHRNGTLDPDGTVELAVGDTAVTVVVTAQDATTNTYTLTITRAQPPPPPLSADATLSALALSGVPFSFDAATNGYTLSVAHDTERTTVTAATSHSAASYAVHRNGTLDPDGTVELAVGDTAVTVVVTAQDATTNTYTLTITRAQPPPPLSADATLSALALSGVPFSFDAATNGYTLSVAHDTERTTVTAATSHSAASYAVHRNGTLDPDGTVELAVGDTAVTVVVTAQDATTNTYTLTITRAQPPPPLSADATLSALALSGVPYAVSVGLDVDRLAIAPATSHSAASYAVYRNGVEDADGVVDLAVATPSSQWW